jgi:hypothetical protein
MAVNIFQYNMTSNMICPESRYCRTYMVYLLIRFTRIGYGRFIAVRYKFKRST